MNNEKNLVTGYLTTKNDKWQCVLCYKENNKRKQKWVSTGISSKRGGKTEAKEKLGVEIIKQEEVLKAKRRNYNGNKDCLSDFTGREPFIDYLKAYLEFRSENQPSIKKLADVVIMGYKYYTEHLKTYFDLCNIRPAINELDSEVFNGFYLYLQEKKKIKCISISKYHCFFKGAINKAMSKGLIVADPLEEVNKMYLHKEPFKALQFNESEAKVFLQTIHKELHVKDSTLELAYRVALQLGLRRSEILGLAFDCIDFDRKILMVRRSVLNFYGRNQISCTKIEDYKLKTECSERDIPIPDSLLEAFKEQKAKINENKKTYGNGYDSNYMGWGLDMVFVNDLGKLYNPDFLTKKLSEIEKKYSIKRVTVHGLRHSCGSIMYRNGVSIKAIQRLLGHKDYRTTMDIYVDVDDDDLRDGISVIEAKINKDEARTQKSDNEIEQEKTFTKISGDMLSTEIVKVIEKKDK